MSNGDSLKSLKKGCIRIKLVFCKDDSSCMWRMGKGRGRRESGRALRSFLYQSRNGGKFINLSALFQDLTILGIYDVEGKGTSLVSGLPTR